MGVILDIHVVSASGDVGTWLPQHNVDGMVRVGMASLCGSCDGKKACAKCAGIGLAIAFAGFIGFSALLILVLYIMGRQYDVSLGTIFSQIRDGFRDSKPKLQ